MQHGDPTTRTTIYCLPRCTQQEAGSEPGLASSWRRPSPGSHLDAATRDAGLAAGLVQTSGFQYKCKTLPRFVQALILPTVFKYMYLEGKVAKKRGDSEIFHSLVQSPNATAGTLGLARGCRGPSAWVMLRCFSRCTSKKLGSQPGARVRCGVPGRRPTTPSHQLSPGDFL